MATVLVNNGEQYICDVLSTTVAVATTTPKYIAWGIGTTGADKTDSGMETESAPTSSARVTATLSTTGSGSTAKFQAVGTVTASGTLAITEAGLFAHTSTAVGGTLVIYSTFVAVNVTSGDSIEFTFTLDPS